MTNLTPEMIQQATDFHGHWCPGLAIGLRAAEWALQELDKAEDEEIVAVVETDMCAVDAIQSLTGCTFGKGNLIYKDLGKNAFTFYRRRDGKAARLVARPEIYGEEQQTLGRLHAKAQKEGLTAEEEATWKGIRARVSKKVMESDIEAIFYLKEPEGPLPKKARILDTMICEVCHDPVMESRSRRFQEQILCIPCFDKLERRL